MDDWEFGTILWTTLLFFFWFAVIWMFVGVFADIFRRDISGWAKAGWACLIVILPFLGILIYLIARPRHAAEDPWLGAYATGGYAKPSPVDQISRASELYESGKITAGEYEDLKQRALA